MVLAFSTGVRAQACEPAAASVISVQGDVDVSDSGRAHWRDVQLNQVLCAGQQLRLMAKSRAVLRLPNETLVHLDEGSVLTLQPVAPEKPAWLDLLRGALHIISRVPRALNIRTPFVNAGTEGTEFALRVDPAQAELWVYEGRVRFSNTLGQLLIASGEAAAAAPGRAPERRIVVKPRQAVEWALYYPPLLDTRPERYPEALRPAVLAYRQNDLPAAFAALDGVPEGARDGRYHTLRAGLLLSVGRVPEAEGDLRSAEQLDPKEGTALALRSVIAVVRNEQEEALKLAAEAVRLAPGSATPYVARSYAEQSAFEIEKAHQSLQQASRLAPEDALVWARLAELELSRGDLDAALTAATKAETLDPDLARTQTVLGFAYLTRIDIDETRAAFDRALVLDPADPLPRLGLGLAKIRDGDIDAGTKEIEIAASLDPNNSLVRSYLGKAYYEQKRGGLAETEFEQAKLLDPKDPTPWFYSAIHKQTENRPIEALEDLEKSIELNENRAVYRSRLLLDQDEAVRSASVARIYHDLGFQQLAQLQATTSLGLDPSNHSAHRFLSDSLAKRPRHEIARVSELLQAQLLQPVNVNPVQPSFAETDLNILAGVGPAETSYNEFTPLFLRNQVRLHATGVVGNNGTRGDEIVLPSILGNSSLSFGQFHVASDGFRENNDVEHNIYDVYAQTNLTSTVGTQFEYRRRETEQGDVRLNFNPRNFFRESRRNVEQDSWRLGLHLAPAPHSDLIGSIIYSDRTVKVSDVEAFSTTDDESNTVGYDGQGQYLFHSPLLNLSLGGGASSFDVDQNVVCTEFLDEALTESFNRTSTPSAFAVDQNNVYLYSYMTLPANMTWTLGLSYDSFDDGTIDFDELNYKFGLRWNVNDRLRVRGAAFETMKRLLAVDQTIEPTQVAGFNQFFDDTNASRSRLYGVGLDVTVADGLYSGVEATWRDIRVPTIISRDERAFEQFSRDEDLYRAYLYWTPTRAWAIRAEFEFEDVRTEQLGAPRKVQTASIPVSARYYADVGLFGELGVTHVSQELALADAAEEDFIVVDAAVGYRLPKRWGIISFEIKNLLDEDFLFQDLNFVKSEPTIDPRYIPDRTIFGRISLTF